MPDSVWDAVLTWGPGALGFILVYLIVRTGDLRTRWEVQALERQITTAEAHIKDVARTLRENAVQHQREMDLLEEVVRDLRERRGRGAES